MHLQSVMAELPEKAVEKSGHVVQTIEPEAAKAFAPQETQVEASDANAVLE